MKRLAILLCLAVSAAPPAFAGIEDDVILQLQAQGYEQITVGRTWLGRIVVTARRGEVEREIVLNRRTGEILGDYASAPGDPPPRRSASADNDDNDDQPTSRSGVATEGGDGAATSVTDEDAEMIDSGSLADEGGDKDKGGGN